MASSMHTLRKALLSHPEGARVVAGASLFRARSLARLAFLMIHVLNEAGFNLLESALAAPTVIDYVWGYVIEEQAGISGPELEDFAPRIEKIVSPLGFDFVDEVMKERFKVTNDQVFDWDYRR
jgi:hypothetical protein